MPSNETIASHRLFRCRMCGECCKGYGGTSVNADEIENISAYLGIPPERFIEDFCVFSGRQPVLAQGADGYCVFSENNGCRIHSVKPNMCRQWPFIPSILVDIDNWEIMADSCPGMRLGASAETIRRCVKKALATT
ncbi:MAG: YkgJ family cysteine cluster protein [Desulfobacteraceae bacterium]|nr:YkgJ family cysteine cluster protein [Desulfobacteraceae bacterium]